MILNADKNWIDYKTPSAPLKLRPYGAIQICLLLLLLLYRTLIYSTLYLFITRIFKTFRTSIVQPVVYTLEQVVQSLVEQAVKCKELARKRLHIMGSSKRRERQT